MDKLHAQAVLALLGQQKATIETMERMIIGLLKEDPKENPAHKKLEEEHRVHEALNQAQMGMDKMFQDYNEKLSEGDTSEQFLQRRIPDGPFPSLRSPRPAYLDSQHFREGEIAHKVNEPRYEPLNQNHPLPTGDAAMREAMDILNGDFATGRYQG